MLFNNSKSRSGIPNSKFMRIMYVRMYVINARERKLGLHYRTKRERAREREGWNIKGIIFCFSFEWIHILYSTIRSQPVFCALVCIYLYLCIYLGIIGMNVKGTEEKQEFHPASGSGAGVRTWFSLPKWQWPSSALNSIIIIRYIVHIPIYNTLQRIKIRDYKWQ
jgi:hypothetical protein